MDYVLASEPSEDEPFGFKQIRSAPMPTEEDIKKYVAMPNECMPSDHVAIICDLEWKKFPRKSISMLYRWFVHVAMFKIIFNV